MKYNMKLLKLTDGEYIDPFIYTWEDLSYPEQSLPYTRTITGYGEVLELIGINSLYAGAFGCNRKSTITFPISGVSSIVFDYFHVTDNWYDDDFTDTQFWLSVYPNITLTIPTTSWGYAIPSPSTGIKLHMRKLSTAKVTLSTSNLGVISQPALVGLTSGLYGYNSYKLEINWSAHTISVFVNSVEVSSNVSFGTGLDASFGSTFNILFHFHYYVTGPEYRYIKNFQVT
jgi:hypothetical protein